MSHNVTVSLAGDDAKMARFNLPTSLGVNRITDEVIPVSATTQFNMNFPVSGLNYLMIVADIDCALIINTNVGGTGDEINLQAGVPLLWFDGIGYDIADLIGSSAVLRIYIHNYSAEDVGSLNAIAVYDPTP